MTSDEFYPVFKLLVCLMHCASSVNKQGHSVLGLITKRCWEHERAHEIGQVRLM